MSGAAASDARKISASRRGDNAWLTRFLETPEITIGLQQLPGLWFHTDVVFICDRPKGLEAGVWMARSVRGALGRVLKRWHRDGRACAASATPFEVFYQFHAQIGREHVPRPIRFSVRETGDRLHITLRLFGHGYLWRDDLIEAMVQALAGGIGLKENGRVLRPWPLRDWWWRQTRSISVPAIQPPAVLRFTTPFKPGSSTAFSGDFASSLASLARRIALLARWSRLSVDIPWDELDHARNCVDLSREPFNTRLDGLIKRRIDADGQICEEVVIGVTEMRQLSEVGSVLAIVLHLGMQAHIGGHGAYGFGQFEMNGLE